MTQLALDPYFRTIKGFAVLVEKEWTSFGHKFQDRCGHLENESTEVSCVFLQFLDCVYQFMVQFPQYFQFNPRLLLILADAVYDGKYGTFLCNSMYYRQEADLKNTTTSVWTDILSLLTTVNTTSTSNTNSGNMYPKEDIRNQNEVGTAPLPISTSSSFFHITDFINPNYIHRERLERQGSYAFHWGIYNDNAKRFNQTVDNSVNNQSACESFVPPIVEKPLVLDTRKIQLWTEYYCRWDPTIEPE